MLDRNGRSYKALSFLRRETIRKRKGLKKSIPLQTYIPQQRLVQISLPTNGFTLAPV